MHIQLWEYSISYMTIVSQLAFDVKNEIKVILEW